jgi:hypothetical protein
MENFSSNNLVDARRGLGELSDLINRSLNLFQKGRS